MKSRKVAILTSGGDAPGMNSDIYYLYLKCKRHHIPFYGIKDGYKGLIEGNIFKFDTNFAGKQYYGYFAHKGGTFLGSARHAGFKEKEIQQKAYEKLKELGITDLVVIGGDGTFKGALELSKLGINVYGIPATIDNDLYYSEFSTGFLTCVDTVKDAIAKFDDTMRSHHRLCIIETMGNQCGDIAIFGGQDNADLIFVKEQNYSKEDMVEMIAKKYEHEFKPSIVVISEGLMHWEELEPLLREKFPDVEVKSSRLGHIQRGGSPTKDELKLSKAFAKETFNNILNESSGKCVGIKEWKTFSIDISDVPNYTKHDSKLVDFMYEHTDKFINRG